MNEYISIIGWMEYIEACRNLTEKLKHINPEGTVIVGIARGGLIPAGIIANTLNIKEVLSYGMRTYNDKKKAKKVEIYQKLPKIKPDIKTIIIVDDISDTGESLDLLYNQLKNKYKHTNIITATIVYKSKSKSKPTYHSIDVSDNTWVYFPYDKVDQSPGN